MLFSSTTFLYLFLPLVIFFNFVIFKKSRLLQNIFLLFASLFFYAWGEPKFVVVMIASIIINWFFGLLISKKRDNKKISFLIIGVDVALNLGLLFVFKYLTFTGNIINSLFNINMTIPNIALPIGISFFTFQAMSYVIDVYRQKGDVQTNLLFVGLYISFFPQLIAGPIVRYETIADEITNRKETLNDFFDGFARFVIGLSKKVLLANNFAILADQAFETVKNGDSVSIMFSWLGAIGYTLQIFFDFSGYSDMAIGLGRMFGFHILENFDYPYISTSITEFWRRWHISLGTWFRDYLYFPLGGNHCGKARNIFNLFVVWSLTGLWHGANFTFIIWGLMYFVLLVIEKFTGLHKKSGTLLNIFKWLYTILFVVLGWVIFRSESIKVAFVYIRSMFGLMGNVFSDGMFNGWFIQNMLLLIIGIILSTPLFRFLSQKTKDNNAIGFIKVGGLICLFVLSVASLVSNSYNPFIYFNF
ncbi:MAG: MBOAT family O-acyltransferase [Acutalibacteraceae bacterium]|nr:MBOAT family O-acyltransferase [Acutalibacteraceae bacterium]